MKLDKKRKTSEMLKIYQCGLNLISGCYANPTSFEIKMSTKFPVYYVSEVVVQTVEVNTSGTSIIIAGTGTCY